VLSELVTTEVLHKHKFRRLSYAREHYKIYHKTSHVYYVNIEKYIIEHRLNIRYKIQATEVHEMCINLVQHVCSLSLLGHPQWQIANS